MKLDYSRSLPGLLGWWPLGFRRFRMECPRKQHIAYIMWHFPLLSETFVQREITALKDKGINISIIADGIPDTALLDNASRALAAATTTVLPLDRVEMRGVLRRFLKRHPLRTANLLLFLLFHRYHERKTRRFDMHVFNKSVYIAGLCERLGVTHVHSPWADLNAITGLLASRLLGVPFSVQARAHDIHRKTYLHGLKEKFAYAELVITNTNYNASRLKAIVGAGSTGKIVRIYNGIPLHAFPYRTPAEIRGRPVRILTVARLIEQKGIDDLLRACSGLRRAGIDFQATVVGGPEEDREVDSEAIRRQCRDLGLDSHVGFAGNRSQREVLEHYRLADMFVLPSKIAEDGSRDVIPNVLIEAMAVGLPCISTRLTGIPEIIDDGVDGLLVAPGAVEALIEAMTELSRNHDLRRTLSANARSKVESRFDIDRNAEEYRAVFNAIGRYAP